MKQENTRARFVEVSFNGKIEWLNGTPREGLLGEIEPWGPLPLAPILIGLRALRAQIRQG